MLGRIFLEGLSDALLIAPYPVVTLAALKAFGETALTLPALLATLGATLGYGLNLLVGYVLYQLYQRRTAFLSAEKYARGQACFTRYGIWLLLFVWMPLGSILPLVAGFFRIPYPKVLVLCTLGYGGSMWLLVG